MPLSQIANVEKSLRGIAAQHAGLPVTDILILRVILVLARDLSQRLDGALKPAGLAEPEYRVLLALYSGGGSACAGDLCAALAQSPANLTRIADALVRRELIARTPDRADRRRIQLSLRPAAVSLLRRLLPGISTNIQRAFQDFTIAEKKRLLAGMKKLLAGIDRVPGTVPRARRIAA